VATPVAAHRWSDDEKAKVSEKSSQSVRCRSTARAGLASTSAAIADRWRVA
jgi:hypothetical protein